MTSKRAYFVSQTFMRPRKISVAIVFLIGLYIGLSPSTGWPLYSAIIFKPDRRKHDVDEALKYIKDNYHVQKRDVSFRSANGKKLCGWFFELPHTKRVFLVSQGRGGNMRKKLNIARSLLMCRGSVFLYDYEGNGESEGVATLESVCDDAVGAFDYLVKVEKRDGKDIVAYGQSFGTGVTGQLAKRRPVGAVILHSGYPSLLTAGRDTLPWLWLYPDSCFPKQILDNVAVFRSEHPPLLIVHGTKDNLLPYRRSEELYYLAKQPKIMLAIPGGDHGCFGTSNEFVTAVEQFLRINSI